MGNPEIEETLKNISDSVNADDQVPEQEADENDADDEYISNDSELGLWISQIQAKAQINVDKKIGEINSFYLPEYFKQLGYLMRDFPLWTGAMVQFFSSKYKHASSAYVESHFCDRKQRMLKKFGRPIRVDRYVKIEIADQDGCAKLFNSKLREVPSSNTEHCEIPKNTNSPEKSHDDSDNSDLMSFENWRNRVKVEKNASPPSDIDCES